MLEFDTLMLAIVPLIAIFYGYFVIKVFKQSVFKDFERKFFRAIISILNNNENNEECAKQLNLNFRKLSEKYPTLSSNVKSSVDLLENLIHYHDTLGEKKFMIRSRLEITNDMRNRVVKITDEMRKKNPFVTLPPKDANLLINLEHAINTENTELGSAILKQLAEETEVKESNIMIQRKRSTTAYLMAAVGLILTTFFGFLSLASI